MEKLFELINDGWDIKISTKAKRMDIGEGRDWYARVVWEAVSTSSKLECAWEGFENAQDAIDDMISKISKSHNGEAI